MKKTAIISGIILGIILIVFVSFYLMVKSFLTEERITKFSENTIEEATGLDAQIEKVSPRISLTGVNIVVYDLKLYKEKREVVSSREIELGLKLIPLIFKRIEIRKVSVIEPEFEYRLKKKKIIKKQKAEQKEPLQELPFTLLLENFEIKNGNFKIYNGEKIEIKNFNLSSRGSLKGNIFIADGKSRFKIHIKNSDFTMSNRFSFEMNMKKDLLEIKNLNINIMENVLNIKGNIKNMLAGNPNYELSVVSKKFELRKLSTFLRNELSINGVLDINLNIEGAKVPFIYGSIKSENIDLRFQKNSFSIKNFETDFKGEKIFFSFSTVLQNIKSRVDGSLRILPSLYFRVNSKFEGNLKDFTGINNNFQLKLNLSGNNKKANLKGNFLSGKNKLNIDLNLDIDKKIDVSGNISSSYFNMNEIVKTEKNKDSKQKPGKEPPFLLPPNLKIKINLFMKEFIYRKDSFRNLKFELKGEGTKIEIKNFRGEAFGGVVEGSGTLKKGSLLLSTNLKARNIKIERILSSYKFIPGKLTGNMTINSSTSMNLENIVESLNSSNSSIVINGYFEGNNVLKKLSEVLNIKELKKLNFQRMDLKFEIRKGFLYFPNFKIKANDLDILPGGKVSLKGILDLKVDFLFKGNYIRKLRNSGILPGIVSNINEIPLSIYIRGTYGKPELKIDLSKLESKIKSSIEKKVKKKLKKEKEKIKKEIERELEKLKKKFGG